MNSSDLVVVAVVPFIFVAIVVVDHDDEVSIGEVDVVLVVMRCL